LGSVLVLYLDELGPETILSYTLVAQRSGKVQLGPTRIRPIERPEAAEEPGSPVTVVVQ